MHSHFTETISESIWDSAIVLTPQDAVSFLNHKENFRSFSQGLTQLICKYGYEKDPEDIEEKTNFVSKSLSSFPNPPVKSTIKDWFSDKRRPGPNSTSRTHLFHLCFALSISMEDVQWFFGHVYFDRCFNCHTKDEAVYYYCLSRKLPYSHAQSLLAAVNSLPEPPQTQTINRFTSDIRTRLDNCANDDELLAFFTDNLSVFRQWNTTALKYIREYLSRIQGKPSDKAVLEAYKAGKPLFAQDVENCSLIIREYLATSNQGMRHSISQKNITSIDFMLDQILTVNTGLSREAPIPEIVRRCFPSKKTFSAILNKAKTLTSYDALRKCLVLLQFYAFWVTLVLKPEMYSTHLNEWFDIYCDEANALLAECGYEELFAGNPYDWLFLWSATTNEPLKTLREVIDCLYSMKDESAFPD